MNEEKRKIGEYTVLCSVNVGEKEVILASNEQSTNGDKFLCGFAERNDLFELCSECMVSDDYIEIVHLFGSRVANEAELFKEQVEKTGYSNHTHNGSRLYPRPLFQRHQRQNHSH